MNLQTKLRYFYSFISKALKLFSGTLPLTITHATADNAQEYTLTGQSSQAFVTIDGTQYAVPSGYTVLDSIIGDGASCINTGLTSYKNTYTYKFGIKHIGTSTLFVFAQNPETNQNNIALFNTATGYQFQNGAGTRLSLLVGDTSVFHDIIIESDGYTIDGTKTSITAASEFTISQNLYLFAGLDPSTGAIDSRMSLDAIKHFIVYDENGSLIRAFIPMKNSSNVLGMYDFVTNTFYTNAGTGTFTAGNEAPCPERPVDVVSVGDNVPNLWTGDTFDGYFGAVLYSSQLIYVRSSTKMYYFPIESGKTYTVSSASCNRFRIGLSTSVPAEGGTVYVVYIDDTEQEHSGTFTNTTYSYCCVQVANTATEPSWFMANEGSTSLYNKYQIPVVVGANCGVMSFDGSSDEDWRLQSINSYGIANFVLSCSNMTSSSGSYASNGLTKQTSLISQTTTEGHLTAGGTFYVRIKSTTASTVDAFKNWLSSNPFTLYYQRSTDSSWTAPTITNVYASAPLRKVGTYADVLNSNGTITRNVGVKTLDGTENWINYRDLEYYFYLSDAKALSAVSEVMNTHGIQFRIDTSKGLNVVTSSISQFSSISEWTAWLAAQYAAGTPVIVYYPLATATTETFTAPSISMNNGDNIVNIGTSVAPSGTNVWPASLSCILASAGIKVATTKYVATAFADSASELNATMGTIKNVVDNTIIQADRIGKLHTGKQNRPAENCPDGAQCLLITEADGSLHWYPICNADGTVGTQSSN